MSTSPTATKRQSDPPVSPPAPGSSSESKGSAQVPLKSVIIWMLAFLVLTVLSSLLIPVKYMNAAHGVSSSYRVLVNKLAAFLPSKEAPEIVMLGSSLILVPAVRCDDMMLGVTRCSERWYYDKYIPEYTKSLYFEKQIKDRTGMNLHIKNLGVASSIMSDQFGIFKMMLEEKKHPRLLILGLAPRDFLDNTQQKHLETPTRQFIHEYEQELSLPTKWSAVQLKDSVLSAQHRVITVLTSLKAMAMDFACNTSGHLEEVQFRSGPKDLPLEDDRPNKLKDLATYKKLYNPPNYTMLEKQSDYLRRLLVSANKNNINVVVVNMPLTKENIGSLDPNAYKEYVATLDRLSRQYRAEFVDIGSNVDSLGYTLADFEDCCHLNEKGGKRFYENLLSSMSSNKAVLSALSTKDPDRQLALRSSKLAH